MNVAGMSAIRLSWVMPSDAVGPNIRTMIPSATAIETEAATSRLRASRSRSRSSCETSSASDTGAAPAAGVRSRTS